MTNREKLQDQYEDALFALLMDDLAWREGVRLLEENERLKNDPDAKIREEVIIRCRRTINREFAKKNAAKVCRVSWNVFKRISVAACVAVSLFTVAFAASDTVRINTLNLMVGVFDRYTDYSFVAAPEASDNAKLSGFEVEWLPEGFTLTDESTHSSWVDARYEGPRGEILDIALHTLGESGTVTADTEDALVEDITINGRTATFITKDYYQVVMPIEEKQQLLCVAYWSETDPSTKELLIRIVENISLFHQVGQ